MARLSSMRVSANCSFLSCPLLSFLAKGRTLKVMPKRSGVLPPVPLALELSSGRYDILLLGGMVRNKAWLYLGAKRLESSSVIGRARAFLGVWDLPLRWVTAHPILTMHRFKRRLSVSRTRRAFWSIPQNTVTIA